MCPKQLYGQVSTSRGGEPRQAKKQTVQGSNLGPLLKPIKLSKSTPLQVKVHSKSLVFPQYSLILDILLNKQQLSLALNGYIN